MRMARGRQACQDLLSARSKNADEVFQMGEIEAVDVEPQLVLGMRKRGKYRDIGEMIPAICSFAEGRRIGLVGAPIFICHESAEEAIEADRQGNADLEVAVPVAERCEAPEGFRCYELPGGKMARIVHTGPYGKCGPAYGKLFAWIEESGKKVSGPTREVYVNDPNEVPEEEIRTEIYAPIEPAPGKNTK